MDVKSTFLNGELEEEFYIEKLVPRAWYSRLDKYLQQAGFRKGSANNNLYLKKFAKDMQNEFEMSLLGELSLFSGLQIHQSNQRIFISQTKYIKEMLKRFRMEDCKPIDHSYANQLQVEKR